MVSPLIIKYTSIYCNRWFHEIRGEFENNRFDRRVMSGDRCGHGSTSRGYGDLTELLGDADRTSPETSRNAADSKLSRNKNFNDILHDYITLELGNSKKDLINLVHLGQSMQISNIKNTSNLLNTVLKAKIINSQFEADLTLAYKDVNDSKTSSKHFQADEEKKQHMPNDTFILQSTHLEDSNFKNQFFVTRCSFQIMCAHLMQEYGSMAYKKSELNVEKQLLVTLAYLGTVQSYKY